MSPRYLLFNPNPGTKSIETPTANRTRSAAKTRRSMNDRERRVRWHATRRTILRGRGARQKGGLKKQLADRGAEPRYKLVARSIGGC